MAKPLLTGGNGKSNDFVGTVTGQVPVWTDTPTDEWGVGFPAYDLRGSFVGNPATGAVIDRFVGTSRTVYLSTTGTDHKFYCAALPSTGTVVLTLKRKRNNASVEVDILTATFTAGTAVSDNGLYAAVVSFLGHDTIEADDFVRLVVGTTEAAFSTVVWTIKAGA